MMNDAALALFTRVVTDHIERICGEDFPAFAHYPSELAYRYKRLDDSPHFFSVLDDFNEEFVEKFGNRGGDCPDALTYEQVDMAYTAVRTFSKYIGEILTRNGG